MTRIAARPSRVGPAAVVALFIVIAVACGALAGADAPMGKMASAALVVGVIGLATTILHPTIIYYALAFVLGAVPFAVVPGLGLPAVYLLVVAVWMALLTHPIAESRTNTVEIAVAFLVVASLLSMTMMADGVRHYTEFAKWLLGTSVVFALLRLERSTLRRFGQTFAIGTFFGSALAIAIFFLDKAGTAMNYLSVLGYGRTGVVGTHLRFYVMENTTVLRLTGTYVDPNAAGIFLLAGSAFAIALFRGWTRIVIAPTILVALALTLSRSSIFSLVVAVVLFLLFQKMSVGTRLTFVSLSVVTGAAALSVPTINSRVFSSFSSSDIGATDRADSLSNFTGTMSGSWLFGKGWGATEFIDEVVGYEVNYVSNSPLLTIYRGGIFTGLAFIAVLIAAAVIAHRNARLDPWESGVIGAVLVGFVLVGLQLDFPVVTHAPMTMVFSALLAMAALNPVKTNEELHDYRERLSPAEITLELPAGKVRS